MDIRYQHASMYIHIGYLLRWHDNACNDIIKCIWPTTDQYNYTYISACLNLNTVTATQHKWGSGGGGGGGGGVHIICQYDLKYVHEIHIYIYICVCVYAFRLNNDNPFWQLRHGFYGFKSTHHNVTQFAHIWHLLPVHARILFSCTLHKKVDELHW